MSKEKIKVTTISLGEFAAKIADILILVGDFEQYYLKGALKTGLDQEKIHLAGCSWYNALKIISEDLREDDLIYITGRSPLKLERIFLSLQGEKIQCEKEWCYKIAYCKDCWIKNRNVKY